MDVDLTSISPEQKLFVAIIVRACQDWVLFHSKAYKERYIMPAMYWRQVVEIEQFFADDDLSKAGPFSFPWLCMHISERPRELMNSVREFLGRGEYQLLFNSYRGRRDFLQILLQ